MSVAILVEADGTAPLHLTVERESEGGATGLVPTVAVRNVVTGHYLDWGDSTFKASGWASKQANLIEYAPGQYTRALNISILGVSANTMLVAEYAVVDGADSHIASDLVIVTSVGFDSAMSRKAITNRQEEFPGDPGRLILFDDDNVTRLVEQELRDGAGNATGVAVGVPSKRSNNIL